MVGGLKVGIAGAVVGVCVLGAVWLAMARPSSAPSVVPSAGSADTSGEEVPAEVAEGTADQTYVAGQVLVQVDKSMDAQEVSAGLREAGVTCVDADSVEPVTSGYVQVLVMEGHTVEEAMEELSGVPFVRTSQPNYVYRAGSGE